MLKKSLNFSITLLLTIAVFGLSGCGQALKDTLSSKDRDLQTAQETEKKIQQETQAKRLFQGALDLTTSGQSEQAIKAYQKILAITPQLGTVHNNLGVLYKKNGQLQLAIGAYQEAIRLQPKHAAYYHNLGLAYREKGTFKKAEQSYLKAIQLQPELTQAHYNLAILYELYTRNIPKAVNHYRQYIKRGGRHQAQAENWISLLEGVMARESPRKNN